ncbi:MAG: YfcE family phosphodiesterase [Candidatus Woesearchaeota archaeon]
MIIGVLSDTHDHVEETKKAIKLLIDNGAEQIIHCGDFCAPFMMDLFAEYNITFHCVFGNIDDRHLTTLKASSHKNIVLYGDTAVIELDNKKIFACHYPDIGLMAAKSGEYDIVFYGHTHVHKVDTIGQTLLVNPGDVMGRFNDPGIILYDTKKSTVNRINIGQ